MVKEKKVLLQINAIIFLIYVLYVNTRNVISPNNYIWFCSCFLISSILLCGVLLLGDLDDSNSRLKQKSKLVCIFEILGFLITYTIYHAFNYPLIFSMILLIIYLVTTKIIVDIYKEGNEQNLIINYCDNFNEKYDLLDSEIQGNLKELRVLRNNLFIVQFFCFILIEFEGYEYIFFAALYLLIFNFIRKYFMTLKELKVGIDIIKKAVGAFILFFVFHTIFILMLTHQTGGGFLYLVFSASVLPLTGHITSITKKLL